jgi:hypothetical protein
MMLHKKIILLFCFLLFLVTGIFAQHLRKNGMPDRRYKENKTSTSRYHSSSYSVKRSYSSHRSTYSYSVKRDKNGKIKRSQSARKQFMKQTGYPHGRPGYVIDHIVPLKRGGCDCPSNMQWQTKQAAKEKDKRER